MTRIFALVAALLLLLTACDQEPDHSTPTSSPGGESPSPSATEGPDPANVSPDEPAAPQTHTAEGGSPEGGSSDSRALPEARPVPLPPAADTVADTDAREPLEGTACTLGDAVALGQTEARRPAVSLVFGDRGGVAAWAVDGATTALRRLDAQGLPQGDAVPLPMPGSMDSWGLRWAGPHLLLVTHSLCPETRSGQKCLQLRAISHDLSPAGEVLSHQTGEWASGPRLDTGDGFVLLRSHTYLPPVLERYRVGADGAVTREQLGDLSHGVEPHEEPPPQGLALAVYGDRVAAVVRVDDERQTKWLHVPGSEAVRIRGPAHAWSDTPHLAFVGETLQIIVRSPRRSRLAVIDLDGTVRGRAAPLGPAPYGALRGHVAQNRRGHPSFMRVDAASRIVGEPLSLGAGPARSHAVAGAGSSYVVVTAEGSSPREVRAYPIRCQ